MRVIVQIGYMKSRGRRREGQLVQAFINDVECSWHGDCGKYLTSKLESAKGILWYLWAGDVMPQDTIHVSVKTSISGMGTDEERTFDRLYYVDPEMPLREVIFQGIGKKGYPLLKGRIIEMASVSEKDKREADIEEFLRGNFD